MEGARLGIQNCGCTFTFKSSIGKFVGAGIKIQGYKGTFATNCGCTHAILTPDGILRVKMCSFLCFTL